MCLLHKGHILDVHFKYRHWFHSNVIDGSTQNFMGKNDLRNTKNVHDNHSLKKEWNWDLWVLTSVLLLICFMNIWNLDFFCPKKIVKILIKMPRRLQTLLSWHPWNEVLSLGDGNSVVENIWLWEWTSTLGLIDSHLTFRRPRAQQESLFRSHWVGASHLVKTFIFQIY